MEKLKPNEKIIADEYLKHGNKALAARRSGSRAKSLAAQTIQSTRVLNKDKVKAYLETAAEKASNKLVEHISSDDERISLKASESVLDRTGFGAISKSQQVKLTVTADLDKEDMAQLSHIQRMLKG